jgi:hypothetical protein
MVNVNKNWYGPLVVNFYTSTPKVRTVVVINMTGIQ